MNGERVGIWRLASSHGHEFVYAETWSSSDAARPLSLSLPLRPSQEPYRKGVLEFFENLLPENRQVRERIQRRFGTRSTDAFDLLQEIGRDCVGALQLAPEDASPPDVHQITGNPLTREGVAKILLGTLGSTFGSEDTAGDAFRISIAGAQEKTALLRRQGKWTAVYLRGPSGRSRPQRGRWPRQCRDGRNRQAPRRPAYGRLICWCIPVVIGLSPPYIHGRGLPSACPP